MRNLLKLIKRFLKNPGTPASARYRPELHYMRGPGPATKRKRCPRPVQIGEAGK